MPKVLIVDYGLGNLLSVERALRRLGVHPAISADALAISQADRLVLPGVGAFGEGMANLRQRNLISSMQAFADSGRPILGICLGMQLLMSESEEFGQHRGLDLVKGKVVRLRLPQPGDRFKVPHIGWNGLQVPPERGAGTGGWEQTCLRGLRERSFMYFVHSYVVVTEQPDRRLAVTQHGYDTFCSALKQGNITGLQFHPERSGEEGLEIYRSFVHDN